ncbi:hypothetical protein KGF54_002266 [Candida jiufengensis]|uniref:uncharacterized protein n=1 Tax=Candida jiufengensis TaxID=497108 RepID=UPI002224E8D7|nr:uncharacterized protein KGF54_002266 [Candida jiufengensis]KAI5954491.1 hypothetical protein KGF54_002266 [Candida jiufengensis]
MYLSLTNLITDSSITYSYPLNFILKFEQITTTLSLTLVSLIISSGIILFLIDLGLFLSLKFKLKYNKDRVFMIHTSTKYNRTNNGNGKHIAKENLIKNGGGNSNSNHITKLLIKENITIH